MRRKAKKRFPPGRPAILDDDSIERVMKRSPFARWMLISNGKEALEVLAYEEGNHYIGYPWPLPDGAYVMDDGLPGFGDNTVQLWPKSEWQRLVLALRKA